ncbi:MAG TPA: hypothetical protein VFH22_11355 [Rhodocyclaceae bacterium]|nr:hypothetical protein [Rhodocyclaceae bacterium]
MDDFFSNEPRDGGMTDGELDDYCGRLESLPLDDAVWVAQVLAECKRARTAESELRGAVDGASSEVLQEMAQDVAQVVLDTAEWLKTLWNVGYMGAGRFPAAPRTEFPQVEVEDVLKSALLQRIRNGHRPLPFPPPTRQGMPWHEVVESDEAFIVEASLIRDDADTVVGVSIEACTDWVICEIRQAGLEMLVQHQGKGPRYVLHIDPLFSRLQRMAAEWTRQIVVQERAGFRTYSLLWPEEGKPAPRRISLRAVTWERAEAEAQYWVASNFPAMYGQIRFEEVAA